MYVGAGDPAELVAALFFGGARVDCAACAEGGSGLHCVRGEAMGRPETTRGDFFGKSDFGME